MKIPSKKDIKKITDYLWEIPKDFREDMRVPARFYASLKMLDEVFRDKSLWQLINTATLPGVVKHALAMPDMHEGYGFPIGGVVATEYKKGVISPGGVGFDINCGVRLLISEYKEEEIRSYLEKIAKEIQKEVPSGLGRGHQKKVSFVEIEKILKKGAKRIVELGYGKKEDLENCESEGCIEMADPTAVSSKAKERGRDQVGTLGSGNHFLEIQKVSEIYDKKTAEIFGLFENQVVIMIHTGSRGLGHQIASDYIRLMIQAMPKYGISLPDRELACVPISSPEGQRYFRAMSAGANFAWANRQMITFYVRKAWKKFFEKELHLLYDVAHNIAKIEEHEVSGKRIKLCLHRKGATRAFPPDHPELPEKYKKVGQPVLIPGSMGTASYVLVGTKEGKSAFFSTCHGAGRRMSRRKAIQTIQGAQVVEELKRKGIIVKCYSMRGVAEEAPQAYKNIDNVVEVVDKAGLSKKVAKLSPLAVIKGE